MLSRRVFLGAAAAITLPATIRSVMAAEPAFSLGKLPYAYDSLEPVIDAETMTIHHSKHHQAYVDNLNKALPTTTDKLETILANLAKLPEATRTAVQNNGGGHWNHTFFWSIMTKPGTGGEPKADLLKAIDASFGNLDGLKKAVLDAATKRFGSGWAWIIRGKDKPLAVVSTANQDTPIMTGAKPILGVDVWEHAYYLKYRNLRAKYVEEWFKVVNWEKVAALYADSEKS
jgi:superoxide dismutase, Fe-Mn family